MKQIILIGLAGLLAGTAAGVSVADPLAEPIVRPTQNSPGNYHQNRPKPKKGFRYPDCFCTDSTGKRIELGQTTCLKIGSEQVLARCDMSLNNPTWRRLSGGCPSV